MTDDELAVLETLCAAASPGPWAWDSRDRDTYWRSTGGAGAYPSAVIDTDTEDYGEDVYIVFIEATHADAAFIAASRTGVPALVAEVRRLREVEAAARDVVAVQSSSDGQVGVEFLDSYRGFICPGCAPYYEHAKARHAEGCPFNRLVGALGIAD